MSFASTLPVLIIYVADVRYFLASLAMWYVQLESAASHILVSTRIIILSSTYLAYFILYCVDV